MGRRWVAISSSTLPYHPLTEGEDNKCIQVGKQCTDMNMSAVTNAWKLITCLESQ